jgi:hypothetical protein
MNPQPYSKLAFSPSDLWFCSEPFSLCWGLGEAGSFFS